MKPVFFLLFSLALNSLLLSVILAIGWRMFGRPRHAATWAAAFGAATLQWLLNFAALKLMPGALAPSIVSGGLAGAFSVLLLLGFRQRAGRATRTTLLVAALAATVACVAALGLVPQGYQLRSAPPLVLLAIALAWSARTIVPSEGRSNPAERTAIAVLCAAAAAATAIALFGTIALVGGAPRYVDLYHTVLLLVMPAAFFATGLAAVFLLAADLAEKMQLLATVDQLTGVLNRRGLIQAAAVAIANCQRQRQPIAVVIADLDRFKGINDAFGHSVGDCALKQFAQHICCTVRTGDPVGRIGGEEFAFLLVNTPAASAVEVVERIRASMTLLVLPGAEDARMTASFGIAMVKPGETDLDGVLDRADAALYASKLGGRDRVTLSND